ncbi:MAG: type IV pilus secretin PilQ [Deltaproteobacteria bacterium]|nr:type IV pilus secretin PilQ [Deltaproteobacteria bacterium]
MIKKHMASVTSNFYLRKEALGLFLAVFMVALNLGCSGKKEIKKQPGYEKWKIMAEESKAHSPSERVRVIDLSEGEQDIVEAEKGKAVPEKSLPTEKVSMTMHNTDVNVILRALARTADQNIMINDEVKGVTNVEVTDTPWDQVFNGILRTRGLTYTWEGDIIRVTTLKEMKHDLDIEKFQQERKREEIEQKVKLKKVGPLLTRVIRIDYAEAKDLGKNLEQLLTSKEGGEKGKVSHGSVMVDEHNNALIIHAVKEDIIEMISLIEKLDRPTPQVLIEANIVETSSQVARELGIQWGGLYRSGDSWITPGANSEGVLGESLNTGIDPTSGIAANFPAELAGGTGLTLGYVTETIGDYVLDVQLSALEEEGKLNILSSPSITTSDNQKAFIESGEDIPYQTVDENGNINIEWKTATLKLEVTPHVIESTILKLKIFTAKDEVDFSNTVGGGVGGAGGNPTVITKKAETNLILYDGETTVIGGLTKEKNEASESGVPWLRDIPFLGYLFRGESKSNEMQDVLIFITPHILKEKVPLQKSGSEKQANPP